MNPLCQVCGEEMEEWNQGIYECTECGSMVDDSIYEEEYE